MKLALLRLNRTLFYDRQQIGRGWQTPKAILVLVLIIPVIPVSVVKLWGIQADYLKHGTTL